MATEYHTSTDERFEKKVDEDEGKHAKAEHAVVEAEDSPSLEASPGDNLKHDKVEDAQGTAETGGEAEKKSEPQPKSDDSIAENLKAEKELIPDSQTISTITEPAPDDAANSQPEESPPTESTETDKEKQPKRANISEGSVETIQELSDTAEANPLTESEVEAVKATEHLETSFQKLDKPEHVVTEVQEKSEEPEKESQDKAQDAEQPTTVTLSDPSAKSNEKPFDAIENHVVQKVHEKSLEQENESQEETQEVEQPNKVAGVQKKSEESGKLSQEKPEEAELPNKVEVSDPSDENNEKPNDVKEKPEPVVTKVHENSEETQKESQEKTQEAELPNKTAVSDSSVETIEKPSDATEKTEPIVTDVHEKSEETEKESQEKLHEAEQPKTVAIPDPSAETSEKLRDAIEERTRDTKFDESKATEKAEHVITEIKENPSEPEKQSFEKEEEEQLKTVISQAESESAEKPGDNIVEVHPPQKSDIEAVKETGNSDSESVSMNGEKPELVSTEVEEKHREQPEETEFVHKTAMSKETSDDTIKKPTSLNEQAQSAATANVMESSPAVAEKIVEEDGKKESSCVDDIERVSKEYSAPINIEEQVAAIDDDKKREGAPDPAIGSSRDADVEIKKTEAMKGTKEAEDVKAESAKDDRAAIDNEKQGHPETKVEVTETLASKLEEKEEEKPTKESDATKTPEDLPKETPVKPTQKQSNNIISKVKRSLLKAKKAIIGKSPTTSETISSQAKRDIKVK